MQDLMWYLEGYGRESKEIVLEVQLPLLDTVTIGAALGNPEELLGAMWKVDSGVREVLSGLVEEDVLRRDDLDFFVVFLSE
ncbi:hypothetical protein [Oerskovia enterophila]